MTGKSRETLFAWARKGYIQKPRVERVGDGKGRRALWLAGAVEHIKALTDSANRGIPLHLAHKQLQLQAAYNSSYIYDGVREIAAEWSAPDSAGDLPIRLGLGDPSASLRECFIFAVSRFGRLARLDESALELLDWIAGEHLVPALMNFITGSEPVLVVTATGSFVAPKAALSSLGQSWVDRDDDEWVKAVSGETIGVPTPHEQRPTRPPLHAFTCLDVSPVIGTLWKASGRPWPELFYVPVPVVWQIADRDTHLEHDVEISSWGRRPFALVLDVIPGTARYVPGTAKKATGANTPTKSR